MNEQIESQSNLFAKMKKNNNWRTVTCSFAYSYYVQLRTRLRTFAVLWFQVQYEEKLNGFNFLHSLLRIVGKKSAYSAYSSAYSCVLSTQLYAAF